MTRGTGTGTERETRMGKWKSGCHHHHHHHSHHRLPIWGCPTRTMAPSWTRTPLMQPLLLLMLMLLSLPQLGTCQEMSCSSPAVPEALRQPRYGALSSLDLNSGFMTGIVQSFLGLVQPNPFPKDLVIEIIETGVPEQEMIKEMLMYEIGFLVCVAIGVLYIVLMPLIGFFLCCCRCCGNCGGHMYQKQTGSTNCRRRSLYWATLVVTLVILAGNICMFASNETTKGSMKEAPSEVTTTLGNLQTYFNTVPEQISSVVNESSRTVDSVSNNLNDIGPLLGKKIQDAVEGPLMPALQSVRTLAQVVDDTSTELTHLDSSLKQLQSDLNRLQTNVTDVRDRVNDTLRNPNCMGCSALQAELDQLTVDTTLTTPDLTELISAVDKAKDANLNGLANEGESFFNTIPERVTNETKSTVQDVKTELDNIKVQISQVTNDIPLDAITDISNSISSAQDTVDQYTPDVENAEFYRWIIGVVMSCVVLLVVVCNLLGLFMGPSGLNPKAVPTERSCSADCGGTFFMVGAGFTFLFCWLFMVVVIVLFLLGGNAYTLVCKPWKSQELFQLIDTPGLIPEFNLSASIGVQTPLTVTSVYNDCNQNKSLWSTFHLDELVDLNEFLNVSKYTEEIRQNFENTDISISTVTLLSPETVAQLNSVIAQAGSIDFNSAKDQIDTFYTFGGNLTATADKLDQLADSQTNPTVQTELRQEATDLRGISGEFNTTIQPQLLDVKSSIGRLEGIVSQINETVGDVLQKVGAAESFLNSSTSAIVKNESMEFLDCQLKFFTAFAEWANVTITQHLGRCGPVAQAINSAETIVCTHLVESMNAFWFSLGWCLLFLIPNVILSIKLAKYYRRMKEADVYEYENPIPLTSFPRAQMMKPY